jgi:hypothetical protein
VWQQVQLTLSTTWFIVDSILELIRNLQGLDRLVSVLVAPNAKLSLLEKAADALYSCIRSGTCTHAHGDMEQVADPHAPLHCTRAIALQMNSRCY